MAGELQFDAQHNHTYYTLIRDRTNRIWNTSGGTGAFEAYASANYSSYAVSVTEDGTASAHYAGNMPTAIPAGTYGVSAKQQIGGSPAETDPSVSVGNVEWNGAALLPLSDLATSGQMGQILPIRPARGVMISNFPIYLKSSSDHVTPFTSGVLSGSISRDGAAFGPLQSGAFSEVGNGFYNCTALTSGDLLANTVSLLFTANGISGGSADPLPLSFLMQRSSGQ